MFIDNKRVKILFAGDFCARNPEKIELSEELKSIFDDCDIKCLNFEGPLKAGEPQIIKGSALLPQSDLSPKWCEENGFNVVSLANNHALDYGEEGLEKTIKSFGNSLTLGAGKWEEAYQVKYLEVKGMKLGFFSATQADFAALKDKWTDLGITGCPWINHYEVNQLIAEAKKECDFLFIMPHAGVEYMDVPLPEWRDRYRELINYGADAVIAAHPHVPQGWEIYNGKPIFYSLGNFFFDLFKSEENKPKDWDNGLLAVIKADHNGLSFEGIPISKSANLIKMNDEFENQIKINNEILYNNGIYLSRVNQYVLKFYKQREAILLRGFNAQKISWHWKSAARILYSLFKLKPKYDLVLAHLRSESSRYIFSRALKKITKVKL